MKIEPESEMFLKVATYLSLMVSVSAWQRSPLRVPSAVIPGNGVDSCPSAETLQAARNNLTSILSAALLATRRVPECGRGRWKEVVSLNMTDLSQQCPSGWILSTDPRACGGPDNSEAGCSLVSFPVGTTYTKVCGRLTGLLVGNADAFSTHGPRDAVNYLDGVSLTRSYPAQHIWSFAADNYHSPTNPVGCPCSGDSNSPNPPEFVGTNYFCDVYSSNGLLWDGKGCTTALLCCNYNDPPWFRMEMPASTDNIEARICADEPSSNEKVLVELLEIFVQ